MAFRPIVITVATDPAVPPFERHGEPVSIGVACPRGAVQRADSLGADRSARPRRAGRRPPTLDRWGDGSVRWLLAEFQADVGAAARELLRAGADRAVRVRRPRDHDRTRRRGRCRCRTGAATIRRAAERPGFIAAASVGGASLVVARRSPAKTIAATAITVHDPARDDRARGRAARGDPHRRRTRRRRRDSRWLDATMPAAVLRGPRHRERRARRSPTRARRGTPAASGTSAIPARC